MYNIVLVCSAGMSTSLLVTRMEKAAEEEGIPVNIKAVAEADLRNYNEYIHVLLLGPQVRYMLAKIRSLMAEKNVPVDVINSVDYGTMNGNKVLQQAISLIDGR